jgi:hypothetical protein
VSRSRSQRISACVPGAPGRAVGGGAAGGCARTGVAGIVRAGQYRERRPGGTPSTWYERASPPATSSAMRVAALSAEAKW